MATKEIKEEKVSAERRRAEKETARKATKEDSTEKEKDKAHFSAIAPTVENTRIRRRTAGHGKAVKDEEVTAARPPSASRSCQAEQHRWWKRL